MKDLLAEKTTAALIVCVDALQKGGSMQQMQMELQKVAALTEILRVTLMYPTVMCEKESNIGDARGCGRNITQRRTELAMSQQELADHLGVSRSTIAMWETGASAPRARMLPELAKTLQCSADELLCDATLTEGNKTEEGRFT